MQSVNIVHVLSMQISLAQEFKMDHDLTLFIHYEQAHGPHVVVERGHPGAGKKQSCSLRLVREQ